MKFNSKNIMALAVLATTMVSYARAAECDDEKGACVKPGKACFGENDCCGDLECVGFNFYKTCKELPECLPEWYDCSIGVDCCGDLVCAQTEHHTFECQKETITTRTVEITNGQLQDPEDDDDDDEEEEEETPPNHTTTTKQTPIKMVKACGRGDPHMSTFDQIHYDCQGIGEFILLKSTKTQRQIQARLKQKSGKTVSIIQGLVVQDEGDTPKVQVAVANSDSISQVVGGCSMQLFVDGVQHSFDEFNANGFNYEDKGATVKVEGSTVVINYQESGLEVTAEIAKCRINACATYPANDDEVVGMFGTPDDDNTNEWMTRDGTSVRDSSDVPRRGDVPHDYCTDNWCIRDEAESLFKYNEEGFDFDFFQNCDFPAGELMMEEIEENASSRAKEICQDNTECLEEIEEEGEDAGIVFMKSLRSAKLQNKEKAKNGSDCDKDKDCRSGNCFKNGKRWKKCKPEGFTIDSIHWPNKKNGACKDGDAKYLCNEGLVCEGANADGWGICTKHTCGKRNQKCATDDDCCTKVCMDTGKTDKNGNVIKRCKKAKKVNNQVIVEEGEDCKPKKDKCEAGCQCAKISKGVFKCQKLPELWEKKNKNCDPEEGMPQCSTAKGLTCKKQKIKASKLTAEGWEDESGDGKSGGKKKYKFLCKPLPQCVARAGKCKTDDGTMLACCDTNRECKRATDKKTGALKGAFKCRKKNTDMTKAASVDSDSEDEPTIEEELTEKAQAITGTTETSSKTRSFKMYNAGNPGKLYVADGFTQVSGCGTAKQTFCVHVKARPGIFLQESDSESWFKDYNVKKSVMTPLAPIKYEKCAVTQGVVAWSACYDVTGKKSSSKMQIHANWTSNGKKWHTASTGKKDWFITDLEYCP